MSRKGRGRRKGGAQRGEGQRYGARKVRVSDRGLHGPAEALLIHGRVELTGEKTAPPLMMAAKVGVGRDVGAGWRALSHCLMGW